MCVNRVKQSSENMVSSEQSATPPRQNTIMIRVNALAKTISQIGTAIYECYFRVNKCLLEKLSKSGHKVLGVALATLFLETPAVLRAIYYNRKYRDPKQYGLESINARGILNNPVLLLPGAAGSCEYLGDLATSLRNAGRSVFVIDVGSGITTPEHLNRVHAKIAEIKALYQSAYGNVAPQHVDLVAHSMGSNLALAAAYESTCCTIEDQNPDALGDLKFNESAPKTINPNIGKVITIANPTTADELASLTSAGKREHQIFNITAKYDALMGHKTPGLRDDNHFTEFSAGHIGIVFQPPVFDEVERMLAVQA